MLGPLQVVFRASSVRRIPYSLGIELRLSRLLRLMDSFQSSHYNLEDYVVFQLHSSNTFNRSFYDIVAIHLDPFIPFIRPYSPPINTVVILNLAKQFTPFLNKLLNVLPGFITESPLLTEKSAFELLYTLHLCVDCFEVIAPILEGNCYAAVHHRNTYISCLRRWKLYEEVLSESIVSLASVNRISKEQISLKVDKENTAQTAKSKIQYSLLPSVTESSTKVHASDVQVENFGSRAEGVDEHKDNSVQTINSEIHYSLFPPVTESLNEVHVLEVQVDTSSGSKRGESIFEVENRGEVTFDIEPSIGSECGLAIKQMYEGYSMSRGMSSVSFQGEGCNDGLDAKGSDDTTKVCADIESRHDSIAQSDRPLNHAGIKDAMPESISVEVPHANFESSSPSEQDIKNNIHHANCSEKSGIECMRESIHATMQNESLDDGCHNHPPVMDENKLPCSEDSSSKQTDDDLSLPTLASERDVSLTVCEKALPVPDAETETPKDTIHDDDDAPCVIIPNNLDVQNLNSLLFSTLLAADVQQHHCRESEQQHQQYSPFSIVQAIAKNQIVSGETGCGKTAQLPQYIIDFEMESDRGAFYSIICTQPRRISAMAISEKVSSVRGESLDESIGFLVVNAYDRNSSNKELVNSDILDRDSPWDPGEFRYKHTNVSYLYQEACVTREHGKKILGANWESDCNIEFFMRRLPKSFDIADLSFIIKKLFKTLDLFLPWSNYLWDSGGKTCVIGGCRYPMNAKERKYLFVRFEGLRSPKENGTDISPYAEYFYELKFCGAQGENRVWDAGGKISIDCSDMVITTMSICSNLKSSSDSLDTRAAKNSMVDELEAMLDVMETQLCGKPLHMRRRTFDRPDCMMNKELAEGVVEFGVGGPPVRDRISLGGTQAGTASVPLCGTGIFGLIADNLIKSEVYSDFIQAHLAPSGYLKLPNNIPGSSTGNSRVVGNIEKSWELDLVTLCFRVWDPGGLFNGAIYHHLKLLGRNVTRSQDSSHRLHSLGDKTEFLGEAL